MNSDFALGFAAAWVVVAFFGWLLPDNYVGKGAVEAGWGQSDGAIYRVTPAEAVPAPGAAE